jgi:glycosyltransferase involved in cell wall biosynthesis
MEFEMKFSVIVPCYNESGNLAKVAQAFQDAIRLADWVNDYPIEVLLVNNGSTDNSAMVLDELRQSGAFSFVRQVHVTKNQGYGFGILSGLAAAKGEYLAWTHADLQTDPKDVLEGFRLLLQSSAPENTIVRGKRVGRPFLDAVFTFGMGAIASVALREKLFDINAQPKIFHRNLLNLMEHAPSDFSLDLFLLFRAAKSGFASIELPVHFGKRQFGVAKGGGSIRGKWKLCVRSWRYIFKLREKLKASQKINPVLSDGMTLHSKVDKNKSKPMAA